MHNKSILIKSDQNDTKSIQMTVGAVKVSNKYYFGFIPNNFGKIDKYPEWTLENGDKYCLNRIFAYTTLDTRLNTKISFKCSTNFPFGDIDITINGITVNVNIPAAEYSNIASVNIRQDVFNLQNKADKTVTVTFSRQPSKLHDMQPEYDNQHSGGTSSTSNNQ